MSVFSSLTVSTGHRSRHCARSDSFPIASSSQFYGEARNLENDVAGTTNELVCFR